MSKTHPQITDALRLSAQPEAATRDVGEQLSGRRSKLSDVALRPLYLLYERRLLGLIRQAPLPRHIGIILDGNRRFGRANNIQDPHLIYRLGARKLDEILAWCADLDLAAVTLWVCSTSNLARSPDEVSGILSAIEDKIRTLAANPEVHRRRIRVRTAGRLDLLPPSTVEAIRTAENATAAYEAMTLTIAVAYGGREEIVDAVSAFLRQRQAEGKDLSTAIAEITPQSIGRHLYAPDLPDPDLIIRTSGEIRLSGFLMWQSAFSEFYFSDIHWPAFRKVDFLRAIRDYQQRSRRFGR